MRPPMATFGASLVALGAILLVAARAPQRNRLLVHLVIWHEILAGVLADAWYVARGHVSAGFYVGFIAVHLFIIGTGVWVLGRTTGERPAAAADARGRRAPEVTSDDPSATS